MSKNLITPSFMEDSPLAIDLGEGKNPHGIVCAANEARFTAGNYNEPLTALSIGWKDPEDIEGILQRLFPEVFVPKRFSFRKANNAEAFLSDSDDLRPIGSPFKRVEYSGTMAEARTYNRGLTVRIDHDEVDDVEAEVTATVGRLRQRLSRNSLRRGFVLLDAADHADGNKEFDVDTNPDGHIRAAGKLSADSTGIYPNVYAIGEAAWHLRLDAYEGATRVNSQNRANWTAQQLAAYLMADVVEIVKARYQSSATAKGAILSARIYAYLAIQGVGKDDPSAVKRFRSNGRAGVGFGVFRKDGDKWTDVSMEHYENLVATGSGVESLDAVKT